MTNKMFVGLGVVTVVSGLLLIWQNNYTVGIPGTCVGLFLIYLNVKSSESPGE